MMVERRRQLDTVAGAAERAHCCAAQCEYRVEAVQWHLDLILAMERAGEDPSQDTTTRRLDRYGTGGMMGNRATQVWDIQQAIKALRAEQREVTAVAISVKLCPWAADP